MTITCGIQPNGVVTMVMEVLHNTCNMCIGDLSDMYASVLGPATLRPQACISGKPLMPKLQLLHIINFTIAYNNNCTSILLFP